MAFNDLGVQPEQHLRMGLAMAQNDLDDGQLAQFRWTESLSLHTPLTYGDLRLAGAAPADEVPAPEEDSGADSDSTPSCTSEGAINVVERGADNTGNQVIDGVLDGLIAAGAKLYFPPGEYKIRNVNTSANNITFCGEDAVLFPAGSPRTWMRLSGNGWVFDGFQFDPARPHNPQPDTWLMANGNNWEVRNVEVIAEASSGNRIFMAWVPNRSATGTFKNIKAIHGSPRGRAASTGGFYVHKPHDGTLILDNVDIRNFGSRGIYHSGAAPGTTKVLNSYWENNRVNVRLAGRNCVVRNTTIKQTVNKRGPDNAIWLRANSSTPVGNVHAEAYGALIEDSDLIIDGTNSSNPPDQAPAIGIGGGSNGYFGSVHIKNTRILVKNARSQGGVVANNNTDPDGISANPPETHVTVENSQITTNGSIPGVRIDGRDGTIIRGNCIDAGGQPWDLRNTTAQTSNNTTNGPCTLPAADTR